ncbi:hypothetical protein HFP89_14670 [Wenzhouxiangella sp. XN79A]|uniref:J domain-containing protein n=1 Tax=Wenzhouxiangella sp. XN79A TaxID=2724193 RepID=UPI00144A5192|nr:J domain-containing protein [Wenzhouxiangella sp. XN79A]NKI36411.1 hypothetical protein [Wenzhouxiangella sp. XN79A]
MSDLATLLEAIREGRAERLDREQVHELLAWLAGTREDVGAPHHDPVLNQMVLFRLDAALFRDGSLDLHAAGVDAEVPLDQRKARFRRLASVFHPDRFPALSDWLTLRSQAVHTAYGAFKKNPHAAPARPAPPSPQAEAGTSPASRPPRRPGVIKRNLLHLRRRFGHDRYLAHKLIGGLTLIALLPVINLLLAPGPSNESAREASGGRSETASESGAESSERFSVNSRPRATDRTPNPETGIATAPAEELPAAENRRPKTAVSSGSQPATDSAAEPPPSLSLAAREALRPSRTESATLPSVDAQLAALGLPTDDERLNRRFEAGIRLTSEPTAARATIERSEASRAPARGATGVNSEPRSSTPAEPPIAAAAEPVTRQAIAEPTTDNRQQEIARPSARNEDAAALSFETENRKPETPAAAVAASTRPRSLNAETSVAAVPEAAPDNEPTAPAATTIADPAPNTEHRQPETREALVPVPGRLTLGPLRFHPAGELLSAFQTALEAGDILALRGLFGTQPPADRYVALIQATETRSVDLRVDRMQRNGNEWQVDFELTLRSPGQNHLYPRTTFRLAETGNALRIVAVE